MPLSVWARGDNSSAGNASLNASNTNQQPTTLLTFSADTNNDGTDDGDLKLDFTLDGSIDPDTVIYLDTDGDGIPDSEPQTFTLEFGGTLPNTNKLSNVGPNNTDLRGEEIIILLLEDGTRLFFLRSFLFDPDAPDAATQSQDTFDIMDDFPNGAHALEELFVCYTSGTLIRTPDGDKPIETLNVGDKVIANQGDVKSVLFVGMKSYTQESLAEFPKMRPVLIPANSLGTGVPAKDLIVSPNHRILIRDLSLDLLFGLAEAFIKARDHPEAICAPIKDTTYIHILCDEHCILTANNCESESLFLGDMAIMSLSLEDRAILPKELIKPQSSRKTAVPCLTTQEAILWRNYLQSREKRTA